jgi:hypothetical protein
MEHPVDTMPEDTKCPSETGHIHLSIRDATEKTESHFPKRNCVECVEHFSDRSCGSLNKTPSGDIIALARQ